MFENKSTLKYATIMFVYYFIFVSISFFFSPFLQTKGIPLEVIGFLNVIGLTLLIISFLGWGAIADKYKCSKVVIICNLLLSAFIFLGLIFLNNITLIEILYVLIFPTFMMLASLIDGIVLHNFERNSYSKIRAFGSLGAAISYFVNSYVLKNINYTTLIFFQFLLIFILIFTLYYTLIKQEQKEKIKYSKALREVKKKPQILLVLIITFLTYGVLGADDAYTTTYNVDFIGIGMLIYGFAGFLSILLEGSLMFIYNFFLRVIGIIPMLLIASISLLFIYISRFALIDYPFIINLGNVGLGIFVAFFVPSSIYILDKYSNENIKNTILGLYQSAIKLGGVTIGLITASYYALNQSFEKLYMLHSILIFISLFFIIALSISIKKDEEK